MVPETVLNVPKIRIVDALSDSMEGNRHAFPVNNAIRMQRHTTAAMLEAQQTRWSVNVKRATLETECDVRLAKHAAFSQQLPINV